MISVFANLICALIPDREVFTGQHAKVFWSTSFCIFWVFEPSDVGIAICGSAVDPSGELRPLEDRRRRDRLRVAVRLRIHNLVARSRLLNTEKT